MNKPKISIVIPCYNIEDYITQCLSSLLNQTYENIEIICVDDGSTDNTAETVERIMQNDNRIKLVRQRNMYAGVARNNGMKHASGEYILFFDGDDFCEKEMLAEMIATAEMYHSDIVVCDVKTFDNVTRRYDETNTFLRIGLVEKHKSRGFVSYRDIPDDIMIFASSGPWNKLYRLSFIKKNNLQFQASRRDNDEYFVLMSMALANRISWVDKKFVTYRVNNALSLQGFGNQKIDTNDLLSTVTELKKGLEKANVCKEVMRSFQNQVLVRYVGLIEAQRTWENYKDVFDFTKDTVFTLLGIDKLDEIDIFTRLEERNAILRFSAEEYLFWDMKRQKSGQGERYIFPFDEIGDAKNIGIYGAGVVGHAYMRQLQGNNIFNLVGWYDASKNSSQDCGVFISSPNKINPANMDKLIIAIEARKTALEVKKFLLEKGFREESIIWKI